MKNIRALCLVLAASLLAACGGSAGSAVVEDIDRLIAVTGEGDFDTLVAEGDANWEMRSDRAAVEAAIAAWERAVHVPTPPEVNRRAAMAPLFVKISGAYYWLAHAHERYAESTTSESMQALYEQGMDWGARALALNNESWNRALIYETPIPEAVVHLTPADVPAAYWYATNLGRWGLERGIATVLSRVNDIKAIMDRVEALNDDYFYNATNRYFGVYYTKLPFGNPDIEQARRRFEECIARYPEYLETRVLYGYDLVVVTQERDVAVEQLQAILDADIDALPPELYPENLNAQRRARQLLDSIDEWVR